EPQPRGGRRLRPIHADPPPCSGELRADAGAGGRPVSRGSEPRTRFPRSTAGSRPFELCFRRARPPTSNHHAILWTAAPSLPTFLIELMNSIACYWPLQLESNQDRVNQSNACRSDRKSPSKSTIQKNAFDAPM